MAAGSIVVDLLMRTGSFETDTARAEKRLKAFQKQAEATGKAIGAALTIGAGLAAVAFEKLVSAAGEFKDLEEQTGASAESLASLAVVAAVASTNVSELAGLMNKLTKNLTGVDDESKAAGAALDALGIPIDEFKKLDPVQQIDRLSQAFNGFADGSAKSAVALALFGKNGAQMLNVFKELEASGGRQVILTQAQIDLADTYTDRQKRLTATLKAYAEAAVVDVLPALNDLTSATKDLVAELFGIDSAGKKLASESPLKTFADDAVDVLAFVVDAAQGVTRVFASIVRAGIGISEAYLAIQGRNFKEAKAIAQATAQDIDGILSADLFSQKIAKARQARNNPGTSPFVDPTGAADVRPTLNFNGAATKAAKDAVSEAQRYLENLQKQAEKINEVTVLEQVLNDIRAKRIKGLTPDLERQIKAEAQHVDMLRAEKEARDAQIATTTKFAQADLDELDNMRKSNVELQKEIDLIGLDVDGKHELELQNVRVARAEKERTLAQKEAAGVAETQLQVLQAEIDALKERESLLSERNDKAADFAAQEAAKKAGDAYKDALGNSIEQGILDGFRRGQSLTDIFINELKAQFAKTILRPLIQPAVDSGNNAISSIIGAIGGFFGSGNTSDYRGTTLPNVLRGGADTGTNFVQRDMVTLLHKGEAVVPKAYNPAAGGGASKGVVINLSNNGQPVTAREESRQETDKATIVNLVLDAVATDVQRGGKLHRTFAGQYGLSRAAGAPKRA